MLEKVMQKTWKITKNEIQNGAKKHPKAIQKSIAKFDAKRDQIPVRAEPYWRPGKTYKSKRLTTRYLQKTKRRYPTKVTIFRTKHASGRPRAWSGSKLPPARFRSGPKKEGGVRRSDSFDESADAILRVLCGGRVPENNQI